MNSTPEISTAFDGSAVNRLASADGLAATAIPFSSMDPQVSPLLEAANRVAMRRRRNGDWACPSAWLAIARSHGHLDLSSRDGACPGSPAAHDQRRPKPFPRASDGLVAPRLYHLALARVASL